MDNKQIIVRLKSLQSERKGSVEGIWDLIDRFVMPLRSDFYSELTTEGEVDWHKRDIYDATAPIACLGLAAALQGNLTSPSQQWFEGKFLKKELNNNVEYTRWLEGSIKKSYMEINASTFDIESSETYLDLVGYGTGAGVSEIDEETGELIATAIPLREVHFEEDYRKNLDTFYRLIKWTPVQIISKFGEDNVPDKVIQASKDPSLATTKMELVFYVFNRKVNEDVDTNKPIAPLLRPVGYKYILTETAELLGEEGGYYEMPCYVVRWRTVAGSKWGQSQALFVMGHILSLNQIKEATLEAAGKAIDPPMATESNNILGDLDLRRGGLTEVTDINGIKELFSNIDLGFGAAKFEINTLVEEIRQAFFQDQLQLKDSPAMTATESSIRYELMQRLLGPSYSRIKKDFLDPYVNRVFKMMYRAGRFDELPQGLEGEDIEIVYTGPLARSQKRDVAVSIQNHLLHVVEMSKTKPEVADTVNFDKAEKEIAELNGVPASLMNSESEIKEIRDARAKQQQEQQQIEMAKQAGEAMQGIGKGVEAIPPEMMENLQ